MTVIFLEGFDKYGGVSTNATNITALLTAGEWNAVQTTSIAIVAGLSATGNAVQFSTLNNITKGLGANYSRLIGGLRFNASVLNNQMPVVQLRDVGSAQCTITLESTGAINLRSAAGGGTILGTAAGTITANSTHYLEFDITIGATAAYQVWLDGVSIISGTGNTRGGTTNNYANAFVTGAITSSSITIDDLYLFDSTGSTNNAALLTSPRIATTFPAADSAVQFGFGAALLGSSVARLTTTNAPAAASLVLRRFTPAVACTLGSIGIMPAATSATAQYRGVVYADSGGTAPGALLSSGTLVTGVTSGTPAVLPLTTPQSLVAGTQYWIGFINDTSVALSQSDGSLAGYRAANTFASGAPGTAPAMTAGQGSWLLWGNLSGITGANFYEVSQQPPPGSTSYVFDATVNHEDLYSFPPLSPSPANVYSVGVKAYVQKSDSGAKTVSMRMKSGSTDSGGSLAGQAPATTYGWLASYFPLDPDISAAWTVAALNAATSGFKVDS